MISAPNTSNTDCTRARYSETEVRSDGLGPGLGPGFDMCVDNARGRVSHIFLVDDVEPASSSIRLWSVTRVSGRQR